MNDSDEILSITEVAANLRCSKAHVYNAINGKGGPEPAARDLPGPAKARPSRISGDLEVGE